MSEIGVKFGHGRNDDLFGREAAGLLEARDKGCDGGIDGIMEQPPPNAAILIRYQRVGCCVALEMILGVQALVFAR
jgi:hypothetical protein